MIQNSLDPIIPLITLITRIVIDNSSRGSVTEHSLRERPCRVASNLGGGSSQAITAWCGSQGHKGVGNPVFPFSFNVKLKSRLSSWGTQCIFEFFFLLDSPQPTPSASIIHRSPMVLRCCGANESSQPWAPRRRLSLFAPWKRFWPRFPGAAKKHG